MWEREYKGPLPQLTKPASHPIELNVVQKGPHPTAFFEFSCDTSPATSPPRFDLRYQHRPEADCTAFEPFKRVRGFLERIGFGHHLHFALRRIVERFV